MDTVDVVVIGAGISGLSCAVALREHGLDVRVLEAAPRAGGVIRTRRVGGWLVEHGPNSTLDRHPALARLIDAAGLSARRVDASPRSRSRYVLRDGRLHAIPLTPGAFVTARLLSVRGRLRVMREPFVPRGGHPGETVAEFVRRRLGEEFLDYAIDPFVSGVYAGDPAELELASAFPEMAAFERDYGSIIRAAMATAGRRRRRRRRAGVRGSVMLSFDDGMETLPRALAGRLGESLELRTAVSAVERDGGGWRVHRDGGGALRARDVVLAVTADAAADLVQPLSDAAATALRAIPYAPVAVVFLGLPRAALAHPLDGFGFLVPTRERRAILGTIFSSTLFPRRAPQGHVALTSFVGGARHPEAVEQDESTLVRRVTDELGSILGLRGDPVVTDVVRWPRAIAQYTRGHSRRIGVLRALERDQRGLHVCAAFDGGPSVVDRVRRAFELADAIAANRNSRPATPLS